MGIGNDIAVGADVGRRQRPRFVALLAGVVTSCSTGTTAVDAPATTQPSYLVDVRPILERSCVHCHSAGNLAPFSLTSFAEVRPLGGAIVSATHAQVMPPWNAISTDACTPPLPWKDDERLSGGELDLLKRWVETGAPEGGDSAAPHTSVSRRSTHLTSFDLEVAPAKPYVLKRDQDEYRCFVLDPQLTEERYVRSIDFLPGNPGVVHHSTVIVDSERTSIERAGPDGSFECMTDITRGVLTEIHNWAPGMLPIELPDNIGVKLPARSLLILLIHYSPKGQPVDEDRSRVQMQFTKARPDYVLETASLGGLFTPLPGGKGLQPGPDDGATPEFVIPINARAHTETMLVPIPVPGSTRVWGRDVRVFNIMGHAHLAATDVTAQLHKPDGRKECLINDRWNFHWQRRYTYDAPLDALPLLEEGDELEVSCTYDNSMSNPVLRDELARRREPLSEIHAGPTTRDEMCHVTTQLLRHNDAAP